MKCAIVPVTPYQQNCSILICENTKRAALVDPGGEVPRLRAALEKLGVTLEKVFLTHGHTDHCGAAGIVREEFGVPIEGPQREDKFWIDRLPESTRRPGFTPADAFEPDRWLEDGDTVSFGEQTLQVLHCPGHTPGHVVFFHEGLRLAFVGDVLFQGSIGRTDFPRGDYDTLIDSIRSKLWPLGDDVTFIPGHGPASTFGHERQHNSFVGDVRFR
ncbi:MBL fold metallo-hydrolase [Noviherbaspirillum malthae]|jgi:glyoxylase-like metal-dependent hydrolase (beta-lactamase superfamily II)|uniref:MBL fold metallo-hydrolase n=1 Tax=Noviherbaspirillum malthae TaxID=1260987 RepID=UPI00188FB4CD|nr:MBL fold metallo-hydrolase [Noviherbaspirillum malthae]